MENIYAYEWKFAVFVEKFAKQCPSVCHHNLIIRGKPYSVCIWIHNKKESVPLNLLAYAALLMNLSKF